MILDSLLLVAWLGCQSFDTSTTLRGITAGHTELNPLLGHSPRRVWAIKLSVNGSLLVWYSRSRSRPLRRTMSTSMAVAGCAAGAWNTAALN